MTPEDRDLLLSLRRRQGDLQQALERLNAQLGALEARAAAPETLPPLPVDAVLPPIPAHVVTGAAAHPLPPIPDAPVGQTPAGQAPVIHAPPPAPTTPTPGPSFEFHFGRWLTRMGALFLVLSVIFFASWVDVTYHIHERLGPVGKLGIMGLASVLATALGQRLERKKAGLLFFGRTLMAAGLACLYVTFYAAYFYEPLRVIGSPLVAGLLLLLWSIYVLLLAERKKSQTLALFAITLAYVGTAINPVGSFTMAADLILAATAMVFLLRNGWAALSYFSLLGAYLALLRRLVLDENGDLVFDTSRALHFWPYASYLAFAWLIFTAAVLLTASPGFRGGKRLAFLSLNNGALAGLLALSAYISGYGASAMGWTLLDAGLVFLAASRVARFTAIEPADVMGAYAAQGLALVTAGVIVVYTGITRGVLLLIETFFLGAAAAFSRSRILAISAWVAALFAALFLIWEIAVTAHHPWLLGLSGAAVMLINAWLSRRNVRRGPGARDTIVLGSSYYCALALGLIFTAMSTDLNGSTLPPSLALVALALVLFSPATGEELPWWSTACVAAVTLLLVTWWPRQRVTRTGSWTVALTFLYALALAGLAHQEVRPYLDAQDWMIGASLLSAAFLVYGAFARVWPVAAVGQLFLVLALYHFFFPPHPSVFPWAWWAAAVPVMVVFATARAAHEWLRLFPEIPESRREALRLLACGYQLVALAALVRWVFGVVPALDQIAAFLFLGMLILSMNVRRPSTFGVRCSFVLTAIGMWLYLDNLAAQAHAMATCLNGLAMLLFLAQTALLRHEGKRKSLVTPLESWVLILFSVGTSWIFVSAWVWTRLSPGHLTMGWALYALFLFLFGLLVRESRLRWCGMAVVVAAILRVLCCDMWSLSSGYRVLTFIVLALITLGIGYSLLRRSAAHGTSEK
jgi:hypothetical protein